METLLLLLIVPVCWPVISRYIFGNEITPQEVLIQTGATTLFVLIAWYAGSYASTYDEEIWNGYVSDKDKVRVSCEHSYQICTTTGGKNPITICTTHYHHSHDWDWRVYTTVGQLNIDRVDWQGNNTPARWTDVKIGEPASLPHEYTNYIKAVPDSLFHNIVLDPDKYVIPDYPTVYDYYKYTRVLNNGGVDPTFVKQLNTNLNEVLKHLGTKKEVNIIVVFTTSDSRYARALESAWIGGKQNDVVIVIGTEPPFGINWVEVITFGLNSGNEYLGVMLGDNLRGMTLDNVTEFTYTIVSAVEENFTRKPMEDFEYLKDDIQPPTWLLVLIIVMSLGLSAGLTFHFKNN